MLLNNVILTERKRHSCNSSSKKAAVAGIFRFNDYTITFLQDEHEVYSVFSTSLFGAEQQSALTNETG